MRPHDDEDVLEVGADALRGEGQRARLLEHDGDDVVANVALPQQLRGQTDTWQHGQTDGWGGRGRRRRKRKGEEGEQGGKRTELEDWGWRTGVGELGWRTGVGGLRLED